MDHHRISRRALLVGGSALGVALSTGQAGAGELSAWSDLFHLDPTDSEMVTSRQLNGFSDVYFTIQQIADAPGTLVNFDEYAIRLSNPTVDGDAIFKMFWSHFPEFIDPALASVSPYPDGDNDFFEGKGPGLGSILIFKVETPFGFGHELAAVMVTRTPGTTWTFSTITVDSGDGGAHPVSGNRQFGFRVLPDGAGELFIRAVDRTNLNAAELLLTSEEDVLDGAHALWVAMQQRAADYFQQFANTEIVSPTRIVKSWSEVQTAVDNGEL